MVPPILGCMHVFIIEKHTVLRFIPKVQVSIWGKEAVSMLSAHTLGPNLGFGKGILELDRWVGGG